MRVHFYYESKREAPKILTAPPSIGLLGYSVIIVRAGRVKYDTTPGVNCNSQVLFETGSKY